MSSWIGDDFDEMGFDDFDRMVQRLLGGAAQQRQVRRKEEEPDEIINGKKSVTYILNAPGFEKDDFLVSLQDREIEVKTGEFMLKRKLPAQVDPKSAVSTYRNGILSVTAEKA